MSGENERKVHPLRFVLIFLIALGIQILFIRIGVSFRGKIENAEVIYHFSSLLLVLSFVISAAASFFYTRYNKSRKVRAANEQLDDRMAMMRQDPEREWRKFLVTCILTAGYIALICLLCLAIPFFYGASGLGGSSNLGTLLTVYFGMGILGRFSLKKEKKDYAGALQEEEYPLLYRLAREAAENTCNHKNIRIYVMRGMPQEECSAAIVPDGKNVSICLGAVLLCVLDEAELRQVLLHEFAHLDEKEILRQQMYHKIMNFMTTDSHIFLSYFLDLAFRFPVAYLYYTGTMYFMLSSRDTEKKADDIAARLGNPEKQAGALAKIHAHESFIFETEPYECLFVSENPPSHLMTDRAKKFRTALSDREADWRRILENEIPSRVATHPTFRQRWEALGQCPYSLVPADTDSPFAAECWKAAETADKACAEISAEEYADARQRTYLEPRKCIEEYEASDREHTPDELRPVMLAYFTVGMPEKMEAICDKILEAYDSPYATAFASYWKGVLLLYRYDKSGIGYLWKAIESNTNYIEDGISRIGSYCTRMGLQEELDDYRQRAPEYLQQKVDRTYDGISGRAKLACAELPEGWLEQIREFILKSGGDHVESIYLVKELVRDDYTPSAFILRFSENTPEEEIGGIYDKVFSLLDDWPVDWEFSLYVYSPEMEKALNRVSESCIYQKSPN